MNKNLNVIDRKALDLYRIFLLSGYFFVKIKIIKWNKSKHMMLIWGFIILLTLAVIFLIWLQFNNNESSQSVEGVPVEEKVAHLEENLKKTLEIMQDLAKKMHVQQEVLDQTTAKLQKVELQNAELVNLLAKVVEPKS